MTFTVTPSGRNPVGHLPDALKDLSKIELSDGREIAVRLIRQSWNPDWEKAEALAEPWMGGVTWSVNKNKGKCKLQTAFLRDLPRWTQLPGKQSYYFSERGIPTIQILKSMIFNALDIKDKVSRISLASINPQTKLELLYHMLFHGKSLIEACPLTQTAHLVEEVAQMLGGGEVTLTKCWNSTLKKRSEFSNATLLYQKKVDERKTDTLTRKNFENWVGACCLPYGGLEAFLSQEKCKKIFDKIDAEGGSIKCINLDFVSMEFAFQKKPVAPEALS